MKKRFILLLTILSILFTAPIIVLGEEIPVEESNLYTTQTEMKSTEENSHFGDNVIAESNVDGSSIYAGSKALIKSNINGIAFVGANQAEIKGENEYAIIIGNQLDFSNKTKQDIFVGGNTINFTKDVNIGRDAYIGGSTVNIAGNFGRDMQIFGNDVSIDNAVINGSITINAKNVTIGGNTKIFGNLKINENAKTTISNTVQVGKIDYFESEFFKEKEINYSTIIMDRLIGLANIIVLFLAAYFIFPHLFKTIEAKLFQYRANEYLRLGGIGLLWLFLIPIIAMFALVSVIGVSVGFVLFALYILILTTTNIALGYMVGQKLLVSLGNKLFAGLFGIVILYGALQIPIIGGYIGLASMLVGIGLIIELINDSRKKID